MLAIVIASAFALAALVAVATIAACTAQGIAQARAISAELAELERSGRGTHVIALPVLRSRGGGTPGRTGRQRAVVTLRPMRRAAVA